MRASEEVLGALSMTGTAALTHAAAPGWKIQGSFEGSAASVTFGIRRNAAR